jgi:DNA-binding response OmpR family regulator
MTVLLVEDDAAVRLTLEEFFEIAGLQVMAAADAEEAMAILARNRRCIDILVTDLDLGPGDDGLVLAAMARRARPSLRVIYATGSPERLAGHALDPTDRVFLKPFDPSVLAQAVQALSAKALAARIASKDRSEQGRSGEGWVARRQAEPGCVGSSR